MKPFKSFKKASKFIPRDNGRSERKSFKKFDRNDRNDSGKFGSRSDRPNRSFGTKESRSGNGFTLHEAVCDKCGNKCDLPFEPTGNKPIYCRSCFRQTKSEGGHTNRFEPKRFDDRHESNMPDTSSESLDAINRKLDRIMKALKIN